MIKISQLKRDLIGLRRCERFCRRSLRIHRLCLIHFLRIRIIMVADVAVLVLVVVCIIIEAKEKILSRLQLIYRRERGLKNLIIK